MKYLVIFILILYNLNFSQTEGLMKHIGNFPNVYDADMNNLGEIFLTSQSGVKKTADTGKVWNNLTVQGGIYYRVVISKITNTIFLGHKNGGNILRSNDNGDTWNECINTTGAVNAMHVDNEGNIYAGLTNGHLYISKNDGNSWTSVPVTDTLIQGIASVSPYNVYVATSGDGVYYSTNTGLNWNKINNSAIYANTRSIAINDSGYIFLSGFGDVVFSKDLGITWEVSYVGWPNLYYFAVDRGRTVYAGGYGFKSSIDFGLNWMNLIAPGTINKFTSVDDDLLILTEQGLFYLNNSFQINSSRNFMPMQVGNKYQIKRNKSGFDHGEPSYSSTSYHQWGIQTDTIINDKKFFKLQGPFDQNLLYHYDLSNNILYSRKLDEDTLRKAVDFNIINDSAYTSYILQNPLTVNPHLQEKIIFDDTVLTYTIINYNIVGLHNRSWEFAEKYGAIMSGYTIYTPYGRHDTQDEVIACILDTLIIKPISLQINSVAPLNNRPIDTFPFVIQGSITAGIPDLLDKWYLQIQHWRDTILFSDKIINFNNNYVNINYPTLQVGDILKVRAHASDSTIFYNEQFYPETGFAEILVLPSTTDVEEKEIPYSFQLIQNYPNPFNPTTKIKFTISVFGFMSLKIHDVLGNEIATLVNEEKQPGEYEVEFDGSKLSSGIYFYQLISGSNNQIKKMILLK